MWLGSSFVLFLIGGKEGNASCTVVPLSTVCGTPARLACGPMRPLEKNCRLSARASVSSECVIERINYDVEWQMSSLDLNIGKNI